MRVKPAIRAELIVGSSLRVPSSYSAAVGPNASIRRILEAGVCAPSGGNMQRWRFLVVRDPNVQREGWGVVQTCLGRAVGPRYRVGEPAPGMSRERFLRHHPRLSYQNGIFSGEDKIIAEVTGQPPMTLQEFVAFAPGRLRGGEHSNLTLCQSMRPFGRAIQRHITRSLSSRDPPRGTRRFASCSRIGQTPRRPGFRGYHLCFERPASGATNALFWPHRCRLRRN